MSFFVKYISFARLTYLFTETESGTSRSKNKSQRSRPSSFIDATLSSFFYFKFLLGLLIKQLISLVWNSLNVISMCMPIYSQIVFCNIVYSHFVFLITSLLDFFVWSYLDAKLTIVAFPDKPKQTLHWSINHHVGQGLIAISFRAMVRLG